MIITSFIVLIFEKLAILLICHTWNTRNFKNMNVIDNIFKIMSQKGVRQRTLADAMGIDESQVSVMKKGNRDLKISEVENIASCLGVSITDLFTWPVRYVPELIEIEKDGHSPKITLSIELEDNIKADVIKLAFGDRVLEITNK